MIHQSNSFRQRMDVEGFALAPSVLPSDEVTRICNALRKALATPEAATIPSKGGVVGARNLLRLFPEVVQIGRRPPLSDIVCEVLGPSAGLVRGLYFDKPPEQTWSLPWHEDLTIAVRDNSLPSRELTKPTFKAGVPHVEASLGVLESMLTARIHLDDVTEANGPMMVLPGSHHSGKSMDDDQRRALPVLCRAGDVLLIRPLVAHNSLASEPGTQMHRRILHLEFAAEPTLPDRFAWHDFVSIGAY